MDLPVTVPFDLEWEKLWIFVPPASSTRLYAATCLGYMHTPNRPPSQHAWIKLDKVMKLSPKSHGLGTIPLVWNISPESIELRKIDLRHGKRIG